jgi:hypothetical protein
MSADLESASAEANASLKSLEEVLDVARQKRQQSPTVG